ncbi:MAG: universal stress protein [Desulfobacterales bacterium]|jgi:nucleotide-binding universal stress UspA family protein|nr:universal stress protein [Desulfobacteraceae bacterium]MBT4364345.1 universal stress protein [Desulfobacteraceae bacterium]MBT7087294.1 universal stress protein [Desulfobacterales bacterium]MBT7698295.1 universal stress protein [Desulfobacterales bacterium]
MIEIKKILLPCDLTTNASKILPYVRSVAEKYNSMILLLHVVENIHEQALYPYPGLGHDQKIHEKDAEKKLIKKIDKICGGYFQSDSNIRKIIVAGHPVVEILKVVESEDIDLVIMGTHGRSGLEHVIFGSVAENVVKKSTVPVLTINPYTIKESG